MKFYVDIRFSAFEIGVEIYGSSVGYPVKSSLSTGGGVITTSGFLLGAAVK
jgi:hypothetical protein